MADKQVSTWVEMIANLIHDCFLDRSVKIDQNIPQKDNVEALFDAVGRLHEIHSMKADFLT